MKKLLLLFLFTSTGLFAQDAESYRQLLKMPIQKQVLKNGDVLLQADFTQIFTGVKDKSKIRKESLEHFAGFNAPHPNVATVKKYLKVASKEYNVPFPILDAIAKTYNNYNMVGESEYGSTGIMGLVQNDLVNTLSEASKISGISIDVIKTNPQEHIRAAAALLSRYAGEKNQSTNLLDWFSAVKEFSGLSLETSKEMQALDYFQVMNDGRASITLYKENAAVIAQNNIEISNFITESYLKLNNTSASSQNRGAASGTVDYPGAIAYFTDCNFGLRNGVAIDTYVNHYVAVGTAIGAADYFRICRTTNTSSAHFIVALNGKVYQSVKVADNAFHCGVRVADGGDVNGNRRSIGTEHEVTSANPSSWNNETMLKASTDLARYFINQYNIPRTRPASGAFAPGIRGHKEMPGASTDCPNILPWTRWMELLNGTPVVNNLPVSVSPAAGATNVGLPITFTHTSPVNATAFRIQVSTSNSGWNNIDGFTTASSPDATVVVNASISGLSFNWAEGVAGVFEGPKASKTYYYTIRSYNATTGTSKYTAVKTFSTIFGVQPIAPLNAATVTSPVNLSWTSATSGASYRLQISKVNTGWTAANGFTTGTTTTSSLPVNYSAAGLVNYAWPNSGTTTANLPVAGTTYYWTVRLYSTATGSSEYTPVRKFTVASAARTQVAQNADFQLYPNPSDGNLSLSFESETKQAEVMIYNMSGNLVLSKKYTTQQGKNTINENNLGLKNGNYILIVNDGEKNLSKNLIIQNK